ncbi:hydrogenase-3 nickel incorporation protein HypA [Hydrogenivirga caldilitoris]|uniref:Hydrogenase maturation factor HypA n=1 Tax=Hydrogenivirga caldilitoris TaxID=246264 RepID=A0A497XPH5_9AQUI|nr:hydrogenase maturation nickel metallochaperone HypA [Hydrogenivirga caldilitoris]RLJ70788.1 hydrogenase-3 nickel incorporation protein HypA [Hydrogenivirga caldilitoris]
MHEFSIVQSLLGLIEKHARENRASSVTKVVIQVGVLSGVEPHLLDIAFNTFKEGTIASGAELVIEVEPLRILCLDCNGEFTKEELSAVCPNCNSLNTKVTGGEDLFLKSMEMECDEEAQDKA